MDHPTWTHLHHKTNQGTTLIHRTLSIDQEISANGYRSSVNGYRSTAIGHRPSAIGHRPDHSPEFCFWLIADGGWRKAL